MSIVTIESNRYTISEPLYQWDLNQVLTIYGLSLPAIPEIHFTNDAMDRAIVRQATMNDAGVISAEVPNSLLQKPYKIRAYVCLYKGDAFKSLYLITIPVEARNRPKDYAIAVDNEEVYSFNALENKLENTLALSLARYDEVNTKYEQAEARYSQACDTLDKTIEQTNSANDAARIAEAAREAAENAVEECRELTENGDFVKKSGDAMTGRLTIDASSYGLGGGLVIEKNEASTTIQNTDGHAAIVWESPEYNAHNAIWINHEGAQLERGHPVSGNEANEYIATTKAVAEYVAANGGGSSNTGDGADSTALETRLNILETRVANHSRNIANLQQELDECEIAMVQQAAEGYLAISPNGTLYKIKVKDDGTLYTELNTN